MYNIVKENNMTRRVRIKRQTTIVTASDRNKIRKIVDKVANNLLDIQEATEENKTAMVELDMLMSHLSLKEFQAEQGKAEYITKETRATNTIDVPEFRDKVTEEEFMECITVGITKAKKVLSGKELDSVTKKGKSVSKPPVLTVTPK